LDGGRFSAYLTEDATGGAAFALDALYRLVPLLAALLAYRALGAGDTKMETSALGLRRTSFGLEGTRMLTKPAPGKSGDIVPASAQQRVLLVVLALLSIELLLIPLREISYPLYRIPLYFGYIKIVGYAIIVSSIRGHRAAAAVAMIIFVVAYFILVVVGRNEGQYLSVILGILR
jgi:hypothetical protein